MTYSTSIKRVNVSSSEAYMDTLAEFHARANLLDRIDQLESQLRSQLSEHDEYAKLLQAEKVKNVALTKTISNLRQGKSQYKRKWETLKESLTTGEYHSSKPLVTRSPETQKALRLIHFCHVNNTYKALRDIAAESGASYNRVKKLSSAYMNGKIRY